MLTVPYYLQTKKLTLIKNFKKLNILQGDA